MGKVVNELKDMRYLEWSKIRHSSGTAGSFLKAYEDTEGKLVYYKLSDFDSANGIVGHECVNEIIADRLLDILKIDHLNYTLMHALVRVQEQDHETWLCASESFRAPYERKLSMEDYYQAERESGETPMQFCTRMGWQRYIHEMLIVDYLILNRDRHGANMEVLIDRKRKSVRPAPLFDHGISFVCRCRTEEELKAFDVTEDKKVQSFVGSSSAAENLKLVPKDMMRSIPSLKKEDRSVIFEGLDEALPGVYGDVIWEMLEKRWEYFEMLRDS